MRKVDAAEWLLSLTTTPDRSASIDGDLQQTSGSKGFVWFWGNVLRATASLMWRSFTQAPLRLTGLAIQAFLIEGCYASIILTCLIIARVTAFVATNERRFDTNDSGGWYVEALLAILAASFLWGKWLARNAPHRELAVYLMSSIIVHVLAAASLLLRP